MSAESSPLTVLHIYKDVYPPVTGGVEKYIYTLRKSMPNVQSHVLCCSRSRRTQLVATRYGLELRVAEFGRSLSTPLAPSLIRWPRRIPADIIHVHSPFPLAELASLTVPATRGVVMSYHADIVRQASLAPLYRYLIQAAIRRSGAVVVGSSRFLNTSPFLVGVGQKAQVMPYPVDTKSYCPERVSKEDTAKLRARFPGRIVIAVGRLVYYKGFDLLIDAAAGVDASFLIIGDGPLRTTLSYQARSNPRVHLLGEVPEEELPMYLSAADCYVLPSTSRAESFGISALEAQAMGVPAIVSDVGTGTIETICDGITGIVIPPRNRDALSAAIRDVLGDECRRARMSRAARDRALDRHNEGDHADRMRALYDSVIANGSSRV